MTEPETVSDEERLCLEFEKLQRIVEIANKSLSDCRCRRGTFSFARMKRSIAKSDSVDMVARTVRFQIKTIEAILRERRSDLEACTNMTNDALDEIEHLLDGTP